MVFQWGLSDSTFPQVFRTLLSTLAVFNNAVIWMVSTRPLNSKSSRLFNNPLVTVQKAAMTIDKIVTLMFHSFFNSRATSRYLSFSSHSSVLLCCQPGQQSRKFSKFSFLLLIIINLGLLVDFR